MDSTTYSDPEVARKITQEFIPVRVDIDHRPDISERYNRGGFPTTVFLSDQGESIWGATYVPPKDMLRIMKAILEAKGSGEIDRALERTRMQYLDLSKALEKRLSPDETFINGVFEDIFATYDVEEGGFGVAPKFPHPDVVDMLLMRFAADHDKELSEAVCRTLDRMSDGIGDPVEGGVFRYSVTRDWKTPHYEKMLETNVGVLGNLSNAYKILGEDRFEKRARSVAAYILGNLQDGQSGGFFGSQDADEEYHKLPKDGRMKRMAPSIDETVYAGWSCDAASVMIRAGTLLSDRTMVSAGVRALEHAVNRLRNPALGLVRHVEGHENYLFEDQVSFLEALLSVLGLTNERRIERTIASLIDGVEKHFSSQDGGYNDVMRAQGAIGELAEPRRPLVANSKWSIGIARYGVFSGRPELRTKSKQVLDSFSPKEVERHGLFAASYVMAWRVLETGPKAIKVESEKEDAMSEPLWVKAASAVDPGNLVVFRTAQGHGRASAVVCSPKGCSDRIIDPADLSDSLRYSTKPAGDGA